MMVRCYSIKLLTLISCLHDVLILVVITIDARGALEDITDEFENGFFIRAQLNPNNH